MKNFESPDSLTNQEITILEKESTSSGISKEMRERLSEKEQMHLFLQEYTSYVERSKNERSIQRIDNMFRNILRQIGLDFSTLGDGVSWAVGRLFEINQKGLVKTDVTGEILVLSKRTQSSSKKRKESVEIKAHSDKLVPQVVEKQQLLLDRVLFNTFLSQNESFPYPVSFDEPLDFNESFRSLYSGISLLSEMLNDPVQRYKNQEGLTLSAKEMAAISPFQDAAYLWRENNLFLDFKATMDRSLERVEDSFPVVTQENRNNPQILNQIEETLGVFFQTLKQGFLERIEDKISKNPNSKGELEIILEGFKQIDFGTEEIRLNFLNFYKSNVYHHSMEANSYVLKWHHQAEESGLKDEYWSNEEQLPYKNSSKILLGICEGLNGEQNMKQHNIGGKTYTIAIKPAENIIAQGNDLSIKPFDYHLTREHQGLKEELILQSNGVFKSLTSITSLGTTQENINVQKGWFDPEVEIILSEFVDDLSSNSVY